MSMFTSPIFPAGVIAIAESDRKYSEDFNKDIFEYQGNWDYITKQRSTKFQSVLNHSSLADMKSWIVKTASEFLKETIKLKHKKLFITDSWVNINKKDGSQPIHNQKNSILSGVYYIRTRDGHPNLQFHRMYPTDQYPFISLDEHYEYGNPYTTDTAGFPTRQDTMIMFPSQLYHSHPPITIDEERINISWNALVHFEDNVEDSPGNVKYVYRLKFEE